MYKNVAGSRRNAMLWVSAGGDWCVSFHKKRPLTFNGNDPCKWGFKKIN